MNSLHIFVLKLYNDMAYEPRRIVLEKDEFKKPFYAIFEYDC